MSSSHSREVVKIVLHVAVGMAEVRDTVEIPRSEWDAMSQEERNGKFDSYLEGHISNHVDASWWVEP